MIIKEISIEKFRGFNGSDFELGSHLTVIAGQNETQKTTLLGMLSQPFTITDEKNPMYSEKPLCGGSFKSAFSEKFKLSKKFDKVGEHEWTLHFMDDKIDSYITESIFRNKNKGTMRFWQKGNKSGGSGYIQLPVIYLSLKRLFPIGEDEELKESKKIKLTTEEIEFYIKWHNKILSCQDEINKTNFLAGQHKETIGATTDYYDWKQNSAGQDNIGKILLAILSFKRLKEKYPGNYNGGILAIDELDTTLFPASQINLLDALRKFASKFKIQIIFTTHSLTLLENACDLQKKVERNGQVKVISLIKIKKKIKIEQDVTFPAIKHHLNITLDLPDAEKINVFTEDNETADFAKVLHYCPVKISTFII